MKRFLLAIALIFAVASCDDPNNNKPNTEELEFTVNTTNLDFMEEGGTASINISSNMDWTAKLVNDRASSWCTVTPGSGAAGSAIINVTVAENTTTDDRTASVSIKSGNVEKLVNISQKQKDALTITSSTFEVEGMGGEISIEVKANVDFTYTVADNGKEWIIHQSTKAMKTSTLLFEILENEDKNPRSSTITISNGELSETINVYQSGMVPTIIVSEHDVTVSSESTSIDVQVTSNVAAKVIIPDGANWITESTTKATSTNTFTFDIAENTEYDPREAVIRFVNEENGVSDSVIVTQVQKDAIVCAKTEYEMGPEGGLIEMDILTNVEIFLDIPEEQQSWLSPVATKGLDTTMIVLLVAPMTNEEPRTGTVTLRDASSTLSQTITITQKSLEEVDADNVPDDEIWYRTDTRKLYNIYEASQIYGDTQPFDQTIISHTYENGLGIIKFDGPVKVINRFTFSMGGNGSITELYLPDTIEQIGVGIINQSKISTLRIPKNLKHIDTYGLYAPELEKFTGHNVTEDGKCVIIDKTLQGFAQKGVVEYTIPVGVETIGEFLFMRSQDLEVLNLNEGLKHIMYHAISYCPKLKKIVFPSTLETLGIYTFQDCPNIEGFYGNENFHTSDNRCLISYLDLPSMPVEWHGLWIIKFAGGGLTEYTIPEGIKGVDNYAFSGCNDLKKITLAESLVTFAAHAISNCPNLEGIFGPHTSSDHRALQFGSQLTRLVIDNGLNGRYHVPDDITSIGSSAFDSNANLEHITMGDQVTEIGGYAFKGCAKLKSVTLSGKLQKIGTNSDSGYNPFLDTPSLEAIYFRSFVPPAYLDAQKSEYNNLTVYIPKQSADLYKKDAGWIEFRKYMKEYECENIPMPDYYVSTDFSKDGEVTLLQKATAGNGIDLVLMGDIYSDRQIASGLYREDMELAMEAFFAIEPFKSFRHLFNIYMVTTVSAVEKMAQGSTAFSTRYAVDGTGISGYDPLAIELTEKVVGKERMDEAMTVVLINDPNYGGICFMHDSEKQNDWGSGYSLSYFPVSNRDVNLTLLIQHETGGHGFAKLADEYVHPINANEDIPANTKIDQQQLFPLGWYKNIDFTDNPNTIKWKHFLTDGRYDYDGVDIFLGGSTYGYGVWRPTDDSMMNGSILGFNAPSREAIYYRIHKLAYGDDWVYNYEDFVAYDAKNRKSAPAAATAASAPRIKTVPPVVRKSSWQQILDAGRKGEFKVGDIR